MIAHRAMSAHESTYNNKTIKISRICAFSYKDTKMCMIHPTPPQIVVYTTTGTHTYAMPQQQWNKLVPHLQEIFMLIDASKR